MMMAARFPKAALAVAVLAFSIPAQAEDFFGEVETDAPAEPVADSPIQWLGWLQHKTAYGYRAPDNGASRDQAELTRFETQVYGQATADWSDFRLRLAGSLSHDWLPDLFEADLWTGYAFTDDQADARQWQFHWADSYLDWQHSDLWLRAGYQTLAWGEADSLIVTDVLARRDQRWPGQSDLEHMRLPVPAATLNWAGHLDLAVLGWTGTDRYPAEYDEFDPLIAWRSGPTDIREQNPDQPLGYAARWTGRWPGTDLSLIAADVNDTQTSLTDVTLGMAGGQPFVDRVTFQPQRRQVIGINLQRAFGSWLLKTEQAWHNGVHLASDDPIEPWTDHQQWRGMIATDFTGIGNLTLTGEIGVIHTLDWENTLAVDETRLSQSLRVRWTTWNDQLDLTAQAVNLPGNEGAITRLETDWQANDQLSLNASVVEYWADEEEQDLYAFRDNDAVVFAVRYGF